MKKRSLVSYTLDIDKIRQIIRNRNLNSKFGENLFVRKAVAIIKLYLFSFKHERLLTSTIWNLMENEEKI